MLQIGTSSQASHNHIEILNVLFAQAGMNMNTPPAPGLSRGSGDVGMDAIPLEILNKIFAFVADDDCDIGLALASESMQSKLQQHPVIRTLSMLLNKEQLVMLFDSPRGGDCSQGRQSLLSLINGQAKQGDSTKARLGQTVWCTESFVITTQMMLLKRILKTYWDPILTRDGCNKSAESQAHMWAELDEFERNPSALKDEWLIESEVDVASGRYPWSRVCIWPKQGRILIRDRLLNHTREYCVPLVEEYLRMKGCSQ
jgi:hypothetical protein